MDSSSLSAAQADHPTSSIPGSRAKKATAPSFIKPKTIMVTVLVGPEKQKFVIHKDFLTFHSKYFANALEGNFVEATTKVVELDHTTTEAFGLLVQWLYTEDISRHVSWDPSENPNGSSEPTRDWRARRTNNLLGLWILADYLIMPKLQNVTMDLLSGDSKKYLGFSRDSPKYIWSNTSVGSPLRRFIVDQIVQHRPDRRIQEHPGIFPHDMLLCIIVEFAKLSPKPPVKSSSDYHVKTDSL